MNLSESYKNRLKTLSGIIPEGISNIQELDSEEVSIPANYIKDSLNPEVWKDEKLNPKIREHLLNIAKEYVDYLGIDVKPEMIIFLGSMANYNWNDSSDFDLHLVYDFSKVSDDVNFAKDFFDTKGSNWKSNHNIKLKGYDVEIYVQGTDEENKSVGVFDLINNDWIRKPKKEDVKVDKELIKKKASSIATQIEKLEKKSKENSDWNKIHKEAKKIKDKIKKMRQAGLDKSGEFSAENLAFKYLRNNGFLERLGNVSSESFDKNLSMDENIVGESEENTESLDGYNGWEKQPEWHGNPELGFESYKKIFSSKAGRKIPVYIFGKEGNGKNKPTYGTDENGNRIETGRHDFSDWNYVVSAGANSDLSHSGGFYPETPTLKQAMDIIDAKSKENKLIYESVRDIDPKFLKKVVFKNKRRPEMVLTVSKTPDGRIVEIENNFNINFPFKVGQILNKNHEVWACNNHYLVNDKDTCPEGKIFGIKKSDIPHGHELRMLFPGKFINESQMNESKKEVSKEELKISKIAKKAKIDIKKYDMKELVMGYKVEKEHGSVNPETNVTNDDEVMTLKIALAHLNEIPDYYTKLKKYVEKGINESIYPWLKINSSGPKKIKKNLNESTDTKPKVKHKIVVKKSVDNLDENKIKLIKEFIIDCCSELEIDKPCCVYFTGERGGPITTTASYNPNNDHIWIYTKNRNMLADPLRSLAHEIRHFKQKLDGVLVETSGEDGSPHENAANSFSGYMIRKFGKKNRGIYE